MQQCNQESPVSSPLDGPAYGFRSSNSCSSAIEGNSADVSDASSCSSQRPVGLSLTPPRQPERTWTLFTQLMENGGQLNPTSLSLDLNAANALSETPRTTCASPVESVHTSDILYPHPHTSSATSSKHPDNIEDGHEVHRSGPAFSRPQPVSSIPTVTLKDLKRRWFSLPLHRNVLKCSIAYFVASLFTFCPYLSGLISDLVSYGPGRRAPTPSGHMVATM